MRYIFTPNENGLWTRNSDGVHGHLAEVSENAVVHTTHPVLDSNEGFSRRAITRTNPIQQAVDAAAAAFKSLTPGKQALWEPVRAAVAAALQKGDFASAKTIIETVPSLYSGMETDRATFLALFP